jgi:hydrogenase nickel incorporation protein HypB
MEVKKVPIVKSILSANDQVSYTNQKLLDQKGIFSINIMASPGAGKTSFILQTIKILSVNRKIGVIEGDTAPVTIDSDKMTAVGIPSVQINTGGDCHLDAMMINEALKQLELTKLDLIIVENVGNLICPAAFKLGTHMNVLIASVPEGDDKPYKYPAMYRGVDVLILNKIDLLPYVTFNQDYFLQGVKMLNPDLKTFLVSCKTGEGISVWTDWLAEHLKAKKK